MEIGEIKKLIKDLPDDIRVFFAYSDNARDCVEVDVIKGAKIFGSDGNFREVLLFLNKDKHKEAISDLDENNIKNQ